MARENSGFLTVLPILLVLVTLSCASSRGAKNNLATLELSARESESSKQAKLMNEKILASSFSKAGPYRDYKIGPEDLLEITVFEEEKLNKVVRVSSQGNISLPLIGALKVRGLTANELEKEIADLLAQKYLRDPHVSVFIREYRNQRISVMGAVEKPGVFDVTGQKTILDLLAMSGGLKEEAGPALFLIRPPRPEGESTGEGKQEPGEQGVRTYVISLEALLVKGDFTLNQSLSHGDMINIPVSGKIFVGGEVNKPGGVSLKGKKITVSQAIAMAEGLKPEAKGSEAKIFRDSGTGRETLSVDIYAIQDGKNEDPYLKESDILVVPKSGTKAFLYTLRDTLKGLVGFGFSMGAL